MESCLVSTDNGYEVIQVRLRESEHGREMRASLEIPARLSTVLLNLRGTIKAWPRRMARESASHRAVRATRWLQPPHHHRGIPNVARKPAHGRSCGIICKHSVSRTNVGGRERYMSSGRERHNVSKLEDLKDAQIMLLPHYRTPPRGDSRCGRCPTCPRSLVLHSPITNLLREAHGQLAPEYAP